MQEIKNKIIELIPYDKSHNFDYHIHIGQFYNEYYEPHKVIEVLKKNGLRGCWFSSLSTCLTWSNGFEKTYITNHIDDEIKEALETAKELDFDAKALYWVNLDEYMQVIDNYIKEINVAKSENDIEKNVTSVDLTDQKIKTIVYEYLLQRITNINYFGFKIHTRFNYWDIKNTNVKIIFDVICEYAKSYNMPILIHCGPDECDSPKRFLDWFLIYNDVSFVLAHLRPAEDTIMVMKKCKNVWTDTAFASEDSIKFANKEGMGDRVLYGTDYPINKNCYK